jgi:thioredoxin-related protein
MKNLVLLAFALIITTSFSKAVSAQDATKVKWYTIEEAVDLNNKAKNKDKKKFFIDVYTDWCGWCKKMDQNTFTDPVIIKYLNEKFWPVKFDAESAEPVTINGQTYVNPNPGARRSTHQLAVALLNKRLSYPSFAFLDQEAKLITVLPGYNTPEKLEPVLHYIAEEAYLDQTFDQFKANFKGSF